MTHHSIIAWHPLLRPPLPDEEPPLVPVIPIKLLACRGERVSTIALISATEPADTLSVQLGDLTCGDSIIESSQARLRRVGVVHTDEVGPLCDPLYDFETVDIDKALPIHISISIPAEITPGTYTGKIVVKRKDKTVAENDIEIEVAQPIIKPVHDWDFFLNVWMNPGAVAHFHGDKLWSDEHIEHLAPYIEDLANHGQKSVVAPIVHQPWHTQTYAPYGSLVKWLKTGDEFEFDFSAFDRYVSLHKASGIDRAIHCYSIVLGPGPSDVSRIRYTDTENGKEHDLEVRIGEPEYDRVWGSFFAAFEAHLKENGLLEKTYIAFDEKPEEIMQKIFAFTDKYAPAFKVSLAANSRSELFNRAEDLSIATPFDMQGIAEQVNAERTAMEIADLLDPANTCILSRDCPDKSLSTFYVCCGPSHPNTFTFSALVESRMMAFFALQGRFNGFLRWAYNDWSEKPYQSPKFGDFPTGDAYFVYPGEYGPVSSLRWEQLLESIQDYQLAALASQNLDDPDDIVDFEQAVSVACRNPNGSSKSLGDIEIARRLLIPIASKKKG